MKYSSIFIVKIFLDGSIEDEPKIYYIVYLSQDIDKQTSDYNKLRIKQIEKTF